jgi:hypothetical protein
MATPLGNDDQMSIVDKDGGISTPSAGSMEVIARDGAISGSSAG